jgi:hypothetical protein
VSTLPTWLSVKSLLEVLTCQASRGAVDIAPVAGLAVADAPARSDGALCVGPAVLAQPAGHGLLGFLPAPVAGSADLRASARVQRGHAGPHSVKAAFWAAVGSAGGSKAAAMASSACPMPRSSQSPASS